jgi:hypothetical protein
MMLVCCAGFLLGSMANDIYSEKYSRRDGRSQEIKYNGDFRKRRE